MKAIDVIEAVGRRVEHAWRIVDYEEARLPAIAATVLRELSVHKSLSFLEIVGWLFRSDQLPMQLSTDGRFGQPPITLFSGRRFVVDAYFWVDGTTTIHQHAFNGAFTLLHGQSIQSQFLWATSRRVGASLLCGNLTATDTRLLSVGDVCEIRSGGEFIHSIFHLDRPSVSLVVRSVHDVESGPQYTFHPPAIAVDTELSDPRLRLSLRTSAMLESVDCPGRDKIIGDWIASADAASGYALLDAVSKARGSLDDMRYLLDRFREGTDAEIATLVEAALALDLRLATIVDARRICRDASGRFLLGVMLSSQKGHGPVSLFRQRYPQGEVVREIVRGMRAVAIDDLDARRRLSLSRFDELTLTVAEALLGGGESVGESVARLRPEFASRCSDETIRREVARLRTSLFGGIFADASEAQ